jgi:hypothetical protein
MTVCPVQAGGFFLCGLAHILTWMERDQPILEIGYCLPEVFKTDQERPGQYGVQRVRTIENPRTLLFGLDVGMEDLNRSLQIVDN